jgi:cellulose synthase (UDP-forming)
MIGESLVLGAGRPKLCFVSTSSLPTAELEPDPAAGGSTTLEPVAPPAGPEPATLPGAPLPVPAPADRERRGRPSRRRVRSHRHLRDALTRRQRVCLGALIAGWVSLIVPAWIWWFGSHNEGPVAGVVINTLLLSIEMAVLPVWFFSWLWRMKRPDPALPVPRLRVAIVVTKAPSEPWALVRETLEAMLAQEMPYSYDTWLADEAPSEEAWNWCEAHDVLVSTREGIEEYHRPTWPRRTRCKEGNLAYFYDHWGYADYDAVAQLDADHVPEPTYLAQILIPFHDPDVGYVAAPSICDRNASRSWSARGRLYTEAVLHGPTQSGHSGGFAPSCIGSHYAVRTAALKEIGGLGPELAEDFTTTLMMSAHRWQGVFAIAAEAHGDGPETFADCMTQEFQWSRSMMNVLLGINGRYWKGLRLPAKLRLGFCQLWYPLFGMLMLASVVVPEVAIAIRTPLMRVSLLSFYANFGPPTLVLLATVMWLRTLRLLRPWSARTFSWEILIFQLVRWPWALMGCVQAIAGHLARREFSFKVTPKGSSGPAPLPLRVLAPYLVLALVAALPAIVRWDPGAARGYYTLCLVNLGLYLLAASTILAGHVLDHPRALRRTVIGALRVPLLALAVTMVVTVGAVASYGLTPPRPSLPAASAPTPGPVTGGDPDGGGPVAVPAYPVVTASRRTIGVTTLDLADNSSVPFQPGALGQVRSFERAIGQRAGVTMFFADWAHAAPSLAQLRAIAARGSEPEIAWEPWDYAVGERHPQPRFTLESIIDGSHDAYIRAWARTIRAYGRPVLVRFAQEMNGSWYPWSEGTNGNRRGQFVAAWRHVHDVVAAAGATNARWVWSPISRYGLGLNARLYPGSRYVNVVGLTAYNGGDALSWGGWHSFGALFNHSLDQLRRIAPGKPVQITEVSSATRGGNRAAWITAMFKDLADQPQVRSIVWFNLAKQTDWRIDDSPTASRAFAAGARRWLAGAPPAGAR